MSEQEKLLIKIAEDNKSYILTNGHAEAGHNGPHGHPDTPVRNSSHMLIIYSYLCKCGYDYRTIVDILSQYIIKCSNKTKTGAVKCMESDKFDHINGLIGQAWAIEALLYAYGVTAMKELIKTSEIIFNSQKYDYNLHLWIRVEVDGVELGYDKTYNHQCWFAAMGTMLLKFVNNSKIENEISDFCNHTEKRDFIVDKKGRLKHLVSITARKLSISQIIKLMVRKALYPIRFYNLNKLDYKMFENAYHVFDMYGFALLYLNKPEIALFSSEKFKSAVSYVMNIYNINKQCGYESFVKSKGKRPYNKFYFTYNSPAFEYPLVSLVFGKEDKDLNNQLLEIQYELTGKDFSINNPDVATFTARAYELVRYLDLI